MNISRNKVNVITILVVGIGIQLYYKVKFMLLGQLAFVDLLHWMTLVELSFSLTLAAMVVLGHDYIVKVLRSRFHSRSAQTVRMLIQVSITGLYAVVASWTFSIFFWEYILQMPMTAEYIFDFIIVALFIPLFVNGLKESVYYYSAWDAASDREEKLEKENILAKYEILKNQISPHFLFNCFNTLAVLIDEGKKSASEFLKHLSSVYRFVLKTRDSEIIRLKEELEIFKSYTELLRVRFGEHFRLNNTISEGQQELCIAPLTMQILLENALKHNEASAMDPLQIEVSVDEHSLIFKNTLVTRKADESTNIGLNNISKRYEYLTGEPVQIKQDSEYFSVNVPLIPVQEI